MKRNNIRLRKFYNKKIKNILLNKKNILSSRTHKSYSKIATILLIIKLLIRVDKALKDKRANNK